jgi:hypothetical protein
MSPHQNHSISSNFCCHSSSITRRIYHCHTCYGRGEENTDIILIKFKLMGTFESIILSLVDLTMKASVISNENSKHT